MQVSSPDAITDDNTAKHKIHLTLHVRMQLQQMAPIFFLLKTITLTALHYFCYKIVCALVLESLKG